MLTPYLPQMFLWDKSALKDGQSTGTMLLFAWKSRQTLATCGRELSCSLLHERDCNGVGEDLIPVPYCCHIALYNNQLWFYPMRNASPDHNGAIPIPFVNASIGEAFPTTSVYTTSTILAKKSEAWLVRKRTRLHCLIGNRRGAWVVNHAIRRNRRA